MVPLALAWHWPPFALLSDHVISKGVTHGEFSWILEDNTRVRHVLESMGSRVYKTYRVYEKSL